MKLFLRIAICLTCILLTLLLEGCISVYTGRATIIDTGGAIANIGQQRPRLRTEPEQQNERHLRVHYCIWKKDGRYIVQLPVCYTPARYSVLVHIVRDSWRRDTLECEFPNPHFSPAELAQYPVEYYGAELTEEQYQEIFRRSLHIKMPKRNIFENVMFRSLTEIDLTEAELVKDMQGELPRLMHIWDGSRELPPPRRTWYNRCLMPLSWAAEVADIPLSIIATPIGWLVDAIYEPLHN